MTDIISTATGRAKGGGPAPATMEAGEPAYEVIELLFFAYRDFVREVDAVLARYGFGRAHHRVLHFVSRNPGLKVADLLNILKITKQSLGRVLRDLVEQGFVEANEGQADRRQRLLQVTSKGSDLARQLSLVQSRRIAAALEDCGPDAAKAVTAFLSAMINEDERASVAALVSPSRTDRP